MKSLIILFAADCGGYGFEKSFDSKSAFFKTLEWASELKSDGDICVFCTTENKNEVNLQVSDFKAESGFKNSIFLAEEELWDNTKLFKKLWNYADKAKADCVIYNYAFCPFLNIEVTEKLISTHEEYKSEYSFADGYPYGVCPEMMDKGLLKILAELIKTKDDLKDKLVCKTSVFDLLNTDINSFEIETEISDIDWRLYRFDFTCDRKENYIACSELYKSFVSMPEEDKKNVQKVIGLASENVKVLKTVPAFFNIQIETDVLSESPYSAYTKFRDKSKQRMNFSDFKNLVKQIDGINPDAVVSLSLWGECVMHPDFFAFAEEVVKYEGLSLLIETSGINYSDEKIKSALFKLKECCKNIRQRRNGYSPVMWIVSVDAMSQKIYEDIHPGMQLVNAIESVKLLNSIFSGDVYSQFLRLKQNEDELESFFRTYKEKDSVSGGNFIIQKYDAMCKKLPDCKSADLSPVDRLPCWHLRRDMNILSNGDVCICKNKSFEKSVGNVFTGSVKEAWEAMDPYLEMQIKKDYSNDCEACDEFYTFNF